MAQGRKVRWRRFVIGAINILSTDCNQPKGARRRQIPSFRALRPAPCALCPALCALRPVPCANKKATPSDGFSYLVLLLYSFLLLCSSKFHCCHTLIRFVSPFCVLFGCFKEYISFARECFHQRGVAYFRFQEFLEFCPIGFF
jgi:hypothetical protein